MPSAPRRRIWSEFLPPDELASDRVLNILEKHRLEPILALPPKRMTSSMARALKALSDRRIPFGLWPLLSDEDGYWPSEWNAPQFKLRVEEAVAFAASQASPRTVAIDLEPPLEVSQALASGNAVRTLGARLLEAPSRQAVERRSQARLIFSQIVQSLRDQGLETLTALVPLVVLDMGTAPIFQTLLGTEFESTPWDRLSPMFYTSMIAERLPNHSHLYAREILTQGCRILYQKHGQDAAVSLGVVGKGKLGHEARLPTAHTLAQDVSAARAAGIQDLALFSLEGVLSEDEPEAWFAAFTEGSTQEMVPSVLRRWSVLLPLETFRRVAALSRPFWRRRGGEVREDSALLLQLRIHDALEVIEGLRTRTP